MEMIPELTSRVSEMFNGLDYVWINHECNPPGAPGAVEVTLFLKFEDVHNCLDACEKLVKKYVNFSVRFPYKEYYEILISGMEGSLFQKYNDLNTLFEGDELFIKKYLRGF